MTTAAECAVYKGPTSWTPSMTVGAGSVTIDSATGHYSRDGNVVHIQGQIQLQAINSPSGDCYITGLPFPQSVGKAIFIINYENTGNVYAGLSGCINGTESRIQLMELTQDGAVGILADTTNLVFTNNTKLEFLGFYFV